MKLATVAALIASANAHATFQYFWTNSATQSTSTSNCARLPANNNPLTSTGSNIACNSPASPAPYTCAVSAGASVAVEMHQQPGDRTCTTEAIGGNHDGPTIIYMAKVSNAATTGTTGLSWFKVAQTGLVTAAGTNSVWGTDVMNTNCGKVVFKIPCGIAAGDYLVRAEVIALHVAGSVGGAQHYATCFQINVASTGTTVPAGVSFPGAYGVNDPGIKFDLYSAFTSYTVPGPAVYAGAASCPNQPAPSSIAPASANPSATGGGSGCTVAIYGQCGGADYKGCTTCASPGTCKKSSDYYSQCL